MKISMFYTNSLCFIFKLIYIFVESIDILKKLKNIIKYLQNILLINYVYIKFISVVKITFITNQWIKKYILKITDSFLKL